MAVISCVTYIFAGFVQNVYLSLAVGVVLTVGTLFVIRTMEEKKDG